MASDFHEGLAFVFVGNDWHVALIDKQGRQTKLDEFDWDATNSKFHEGLAAIDNKARLYGYVDPTGRWVIPPQFEYAEGFSNGLARVEWRQETRMGLHRQTRTSDLEGR